MALWQTQSICELLTLYKDTMTAPYQSSGTSNDIQHKLHKNQNKSKTLGPQDSELHSQLLLYSAFRCYLRLKRFHIHTSPSQIPPIAACGWSVKISPSFKEIPLILQISEQPRKTLTFPQKSFVFSLSSLPFILLLFTLHLYYYFVGIFAAYTLSFISLSYFYPYLRLYNPAMLSSFFLQNVARHRPTIHRIFC